MPFIILNGKRQWSEPAVESDERFSVEVVYDENGIGHLDHRKAAGAWDEQAESERLAAV